MRIYTQIFLQWSQGERKSGMRGGKEIVDSLTDPNIYSSINNFFNFKRILLIIFVASLIHGYKTGLFSFLLYVRQIL